MNKIESLPATEADFDYIYGLCERTMRAYVEASLGDCFERIARPAIAALISRNLFSKLWMGELCVGVLAVEEHPSHLQLEEIYVEPGYQNLGIGHSVLTALIERTARMGKPIRLHLLASNPALNFYDRLGFKIVRRTDSVIYMERAATPVAT
jgi:ribosomal protein S18 acetylase RimI-like enzyme